MQAGFCLINFSGSDDQPTVIHVKNTGGKGQDFIVRLKNHIGFVETSGLDALEVREKVLVTRKIGASVVIVGLGFIDREDFPFSRITGTVILDGLVRFEKILIQIAVEIPESGGFLDVVAVPV